MAYLKLCFWEFQKANVGFRGRLNAKCRSWQLLFPRVFMSIEFLLTLSVTILTITAEILAAHWLIFIVNKWTDT